MKQKTGKNPPENSFAKLLLNWNQGENRREMPWKGEKDPYRIWISEIILQQTRVDQGLAYYERFIREFPDVKRLARAPDTAVFKLWEGLGYYSRCRNLLASARFITTELGGKFPTTYETILELKGIGPYTAAAISSFAYNLPYAVVDGNVFRVLARVFGIYMPTDSTEGKKHFTQLANQLLDKEQPGIYNQAIMDFGATICKPVAPLCMQCPFNTRCRAYLDDAVAELPVKEKKIRIRKRWFYYLVIEYKNKTAVRQRSGKDIWQQLHEFLLIETDTEQPAKKITNLAEAAYPEIKGRYELISISPLYKQQLSHQLILGQFIRIRMKTKLNAGDEVVWMTKDEMSNHAFPRFINQYIENKGVQELF